MKIKPYFIFVLVPIMFCLALLVNANHLDNEKNEINEWAHKHYYSVMKEDWHITSANSPFNYVQRGEFIWEVKVLDVMGNPHVIWVRTHSWTENEYVIK